MIWEAVKLKGVKLTDSGLRLSFPGYSGEDTDQSSLYLSRAWVTIVDFKYVGSKAMTTLSLNSVKHKTMKMVIVVSHL